MQTYAALLLVTATVALPGPTNTLLGLAGATEGLRSLLRLVGAALAGYALSVIALVTVAPPLVAALPMLDTALRLAAAAVLAHAAVKLWRHPLAGAGAATPAVTVSFGHVFLTTLLNPKALVFAMLLMPEAQAPMRAETEALAAAIAALVMASSAG